MTPGQMVLTDVGAEEALTPEGFNRVLTQQLESEISLYPARAWYPSSLGHPCDRFSVWRWTRWKEQERHSPTLQSIFDEGKDHQPSIYRRLQGMGYQVVGEQDRPTQYQVKGGVISGRSDGRITGFRGTRYKPARILEAKSMSGYQWERVDTAEDLRTATSVWTRSYYAQGQLYCLLEDLPLGVFVLKDKGTGLLKLIPYELDYGYAEAILQRVERLSPMVQAKTDPDPIPFDLNTCGGCGFRRLCYPPRSFGEGTSVISEPLLLEDLARVVELAPGAAEYRELRTSVTDRLKLLGIKEAVAGDVVVEGTQRKDGAIVYEIRRAG